ncbi:MAG: GNAT family N-acetyltransferase [Xanthobacteraceae bacterium]|nr:GNAT family N-acetyltransferase [Xanthobacteraceae bacterium]
MSGGVTISDLAARPEFFDDVADRIWQAWWKPHGVPLAYIAERLKENLAGRAIPRAFVAHVDTEDGATFAGTASVIASDLDERPQYRPWVAAVWVEPQFRSRKIGRLLIECAADHALQSGAPRVYLTARPARRSLYEELGWTVVEEGVGDLAMTVFVRGARRRQRPAVASR